MIQNIPIAGNNPDILGAVFYIGYPSKTNLKVRSGEISFIHKNAFQLLNWNISLIMSCLDTQNLETIWQLMNKLWFSDNTPNLKNMYFFRALTTLALYDIVYKGSYGRE